MLKYNRVYNTPNKVTKFKLSDFLLGGLMLFLRLSVLLLCDNLVQNQNLHAEVLSQEEDVMK